MRMEGGPGCAYASPEAAWCLSDSRISAPKPKLKAFMLRCQKAAANSRSISERVSGPPDRGRLRHYTGSLKF